MTKVFRSVDIGVYLKKPPLVLLWDIDGTIVTIPKKNSSRHLKAVEEYVNRKLESQLFQPGKTDLGIIKEIFEINRINFDRKDVLNCLEILNEKSIKEISNSSLSLNSGVVSALKLTKELGAANAILTGNSKLRANHKLSLFSISEFFRWDLSYFGDQEYSRSKLVRHAKKSLQHKDFFNLLLVGDTENDIFAAKANNLSIAVVAGDKEIYRQLSQLNPNLILKDFKLELNLFKNYIQEIII